MSSLTKKQLAGFVQRVRNLVDSDPYRRAPEHWARSIGLRPPDLDAVLEAYKEQEAWG